MTAHEVDEFESRYQEFKSSATCNALTMLKILEIGDLEINDNLVKASEDVFVGVRNSVDRR